MDSSVSTELNSQTFTEWAATTNQKEGYSWRSPEYLPVESPWGPVVFLDEGRDRDRPSTYSMIVQVADKFFRFEGSWDSWEGVSWDYNYDGWEEVEKKTRVEEYWANV